MTEILLNLVAAGLIFPILWPVYFLVAAFVWLVLAGLTSELAGAVESRWGASVAKNVFMAIFLFVPLVTLWAVQP